MREWEREGEREASRITHTQNDCASLPAVSLLPDYVFSALSDNDDAPRSLSGKAFTRLQSRRQASQKNDN